MSALSLPVAVMALFLGTAWLTGVVLFPPASWSFRRWPRLARLAPMVAMLPLLAGLWVGVAALLPGDPHLDRVLGCHCAHSMPGWLHLCPVHPGNAAGLVMPALLVVTALLPGRFRAWVVWLGEPRGQGAVEPMIMDLPYRTALVVGWLRPSVVVDRTLWEALDTPGRSAVLAHERAHLSRRDPLVLAVLLALVSLTPRPLGRALVRSWLDRAELRADALAAREVGPLVLAETLLRCARLGARPASFAPAWTGGSLERRVEQLVGPQARSSDTADLGLVDLGIVGLLAGSAFLALPWLHHQVEHILNLSL
ncbi:MAG: M48 family metalloprotease [Myxococcales bacterium]|nr:M48 family metalloprotease [Myxococcales bacterium]